MLPSRKTGWIGVDVGTSSVKLVQLVRDRSSMRIAASAVVARREVWPVVELAECDAKSSADPLSVARSLQPDFRGRRVAASLPMSLSDIHMMQTALTPGQNADQFVRQAVETATQSSAEHLLCDHWTTEPAQASGSPGRTAVLTLPTTWSDQLCQDIAQTGWSCQQVDGLPFSLARAISMTEPEVSPGLIAALDLGYGRATFCVIEEGHPIYVRFLKECSFERLLWSLAGELNLSQQEAEQLLQEHGLPTVLEGGADQGKNEKAGLIAEVLAAPLNQMVQEIARSIEHFQAQRRRGDSISLRLFGGGATTNNLDQFLASRLQTEVKVWSLPQDQPSQNLTTPDCLLGPAIALSALAWEAS